MNETGMNNPIFGMMNSQTQANMNNNGMNSNMGMNNMNMGMGMNNMNMNSGMMNPNMMNMGMSNMGMNPNMMNMGMMNMGMGMGMNTNMMNMAQMSQANQAAMNQILNQNQSNAGSSSVSNSSNSGGITVLFRKNDAPGEKPFAIQCMLSDQVSDIIQRYRNKSGDNDVTKKFIFNAKALNPQLSCAEAGLSDQANVFVVTTQNVVGA